MASPDEAADDKVRCNAGKKAYMLETKQCLLFARDKLPGDVYHEFVKTMTEIWKQCADPDGEIRSICTENCIEMAMKLFHGCAPVRQGFLNFTQGRSPFEGDANVDADADIDVNAHIQETLDFLRRAKACPDISDDDYAAMLQALGSFSKRTLDARDVCQIVKGCMSNSPELLEEFTNYLPPDLKALLTGRVAKATLCFTPDSNQSLDGTHIKVTNMRKEGSAELLFAEEDEEDKVEPLPDWITSELQKNLPPKVIPKNFKRCTPSYYLVPHNCITPQSSYRTKLGRSVLNDALVSPPPIESLHKTQSDYEKYVINCDDDMFESDMLLRWFRETADFIANLQDRVGSSLRINDHITPLHRRCIKTLYNDHPGINDILKSHTTSASLSILLSRLNQRVENLSEARLRLCKILPPVIAENYYRSLDHRGPSFKQLDAKRMDHKALLAEAKEIQKLRLNAGEEYANPDIHKDISMIISSVRSSEENLMVTWTKIVHPFLSANCLWSYLEESTVAPSEACEHCGLSKDALSIISDALETNKIPLSPKDGELLKKTYNERSSSRHGFGVEVEEGEFIPNVQVTIKSDSMLVPGKGAARVSGDVAAFGWHPGTDTSTPSSCAHGNGPEKKNEPRQLSKRTTKQRGAKGGTCCSLVVLRRLYQILYGRLQAARDLCTGDLYKKFKGQLCRLLDSSTDNCNFEDFCLKFLGPNSFELFTLDIVINRVMKQLFVISSSDSLVDLLEKLRRPTPPKLLSPHQKPSSKWLVREEQDGKLSVHFERRKKRKLENGASEFLSAGRKGLKLVVE